ncbi:MAG: methionine--tRNA ligase, partial [Dehalococcoidia bacterium]|nr:methionine--tRNA ligase [Dehalococcoidia bacterium]
MAKNILVAVAWPYASGPLHLGQIAGAYLPGDIFARYHRLKGNRVLMVSGSDQHGTPITLKAEQQGKTPQELVAGYHRIFLENWRRLGISFDIFTTTGTPNHAAVTHDIFLTLLNKGFIYRGSMPQAYCPKCQRFMPDRYVEGTCPLCGFSPARGDQCDNCGRPLNPGDIKDLKCRICGTPPRFESSEHYFFRLSAFEEQLKSWVKGQTHWRQNVRNFTESYLEEGLKDRAITRDIEWGVPVPVAGFEKKVIYVWFEAVIGYLSASKEWAKSHGDGTVWKDFWNDDALSYYFIGKDNIPFHTIIWPAMLMGYGGLRLPYDVPANEFLTIEGKKLSTSRNWAVWLPDYLDRYAPDPLRYVLSVNMPETSDTDFSWNEFLRRNNDELVATYGNLAHRTLTFVHRNFGASVPDGGTPDEQSQALLVKAQVSLEEVGALLEQAHFREPVKKAMALAQEANRYLDYRAPWKVIKHDRQHAAATVFTVLNVLSALKTMLYPFLPFSSSRLHNMLGFKGQIESGGWRMELVKAGQALPPPEPLFLKLDDSIVAQETQ